MHCRHRGCTAVGPAPLAGIDNGTNYRRTCFRLRRASQCPRRASCGQHVQEAPAARTRIHEFAWRTRHLGSALLGARCRAWRSGRSPSWRCNHSASARADVSSVANCGGALRGGPKGESDRPRDATFPRLGGLSSVALRRSSCHERRSGPRLTHAAAAPHVAAAASFARGVLLWLGCRRVR